MNKPLYILLSLIVAGCSVIGVDNFDQNSSRAKWITASVSDSTDAPNTWMSFEKTFVLDKVPSQAIARIGADSKYWLKINGQEVVFEGGLKRGPELGAGYYDKLTDDRVQALAVLAGIAGEDKYPQIIEFLKKTEHASPYFEKYVMEALFKMGEGEYAMERCSRRFGEMVNHPDYTTLFEGWEIGSSKYGGGTTNHAWSGGAITVIGAELCGSSQELIK